MDYKPKDLFVGALDIFVILLPGAILISAALNIAYGYPARPLPALYWGGIEAGAAFLVAAYLAGHLASLIASATEDAVYKRLSPPTDADELRADVSSTLREQGYDVDGHPLKVRRWAAVEVRVRDEKAAVYLERRDADRRFFRNVGLVALAAATASVVAGGLLSAAVWALLLLLGLARYRDLQRKYTRDVFELFMVCTRRDAQAGPRRAGESAGGSARR